MFQTTDNDANNVFALENAGRAVIVHGDGSGVSRVATLYFVDASLDGVGTDVTADDIVIVGVSAGNLNLSALTATNFALMA